MKKTLQEVILKALHYADIFDYPLKEKEIWRGLSYELRTRLPDGQVRNQEFREATAQLQSSSQINFDRGYYCLKGRGKIISLRQKREKWSQEKILKAQKAARFLKLVPTIRMVAVTGNLAVTNCDLDDDIDFLVVASAGTLWLTRFLTTLLIELIGQRRHPQEKKLKDKICLNMFLDENHMQVISKEQDLYSSHEVVQLKPLWDRNNIYQKFLSANSWVRKHLPNGMESQIVNYELRFKKINFPLKLIESFCRWLQLKYMARHRTTEVISEGVIRFHTKDVRKWVLEEYQKRVGHLPS